MLLALFAIGCKDNSNIVSPVDNAVKTNDIVSNPNWITLPPSTENALKKDVAVSKLIHDYEDSELEINTWYRSRSGKISIYAAAEFQKYSH